MENYFVCLTVDLIIKTITVQIMHPIYIEGFWYMLYEKDNINY